jgi:hypothetical protein
MQKPGHIFLFLFALGSVIFGLSLVFPKDKFTLGPFELGFYQPSDLLGTFWNPKEALLEDTQVWTMDTVALDSLPESIVEVIKEAPELDTTLQMGQWDALAQFFEALDALKSGKRNSVRVIHYGDSQLEGDRITMQLRNSLQKEYGGRGFGYVALQPLVEPASLDFVNAEGFERKTAFGRRDTAIKDMAYGHLASFTTLASNATGTGYAGQVTFSKRNWGYTLARDFTRVRLSLQTTSFVIAQIYAADTIFSTRVFPEFYEGALALDIPEETTFTLALQSDESPRIFGITFESPTGVHVDNVAMRGASGMVFSKLDTDQLRSHLEREDYSLIILQYGGNAVPYLKDEAHAKRFARSAARQIDHIKSIYRDASIIYIGPSDMAYKNGLAMESYPLIKSLKFALRTEVLARGAVYWDLYDVMGGEGSMVRWVDQEPAFAVKDYIHFTPKGAQWVGNRLGDMVEIAHDNYRRQKRRFAEDAQRRQDSIRAYNTVWLDTAYQDSISL